MRSSRGKEHYSVDNQHDSVVVAPLHWPGLDQLVKQLHFVTLVQDDKDRKLFRLVEAIL